MPVVVSAASESLPTGPPQSHATPAEGAGASQGQSFGQETTSIQALTSVGNDLVYAGSFGLGLFRSEDRGATWTKSGQGVTDPFILTLTTGKDGAIYAGTFRGGVFRSRDRGKSWQAINSGLKRQEIKALLAVGDAVYAGTADGAYRLGAGNDRWSVVTTGLDDILVHALALSSDGTLYAGTSGKGILRFKAQSTGWVRQQHGLKDHEGMIGELYSRVDDRSRGQHLCRHVRRRRLSQCRWGRNLAAYQPRAPERFDPRDFVQQPRALCGDGTRHFQNDRQGASVGAAQ